MGVRGPVPVPDNVRTLRGTAPLKGPDGKRAKRVVLRPKAPSPPAGLSKLAAAEWRRIVPDLERAGVLAEVDRGILTAYVTAWAHMMDAERILKAEGTIRPGREGTLVRHPAWQVYREANRVVQSAATALYLTPTARLRIPVAPGTPDHDDDADDLFD